MINELVVCEQISEYGCLCEVYGVKDKWVKSDPPARLYVVYRASNDPEDCPFIPIAPIIIEYKDPAETTWRELMAHIPAKVYQGYVYLSFDVLPDQLQWGNWRARHGANTVRWDYVSEYCQLQAQVLDTKTGQPVPYADCTLEDAQGIPIEVRSSNSQGYVYFENAIPDTVYNICASKKDYTTSCIGINQCGVYDIFITKKDEPPPPPPDTSWYDYKLTLNLKAWRTSPTDPTTEALTVLLGLANPFPFPFNFKNVVYLTNPDRLEIDYELQHNPVPIVGIVAICSAIAIAIVVAGWIITNWNNTKIETQEQTQELYEYIPTFADELSSLGFTPDEILQIMDVIGTTKTDWTKYILPVVGIAALAYFLASKPWK